MNDERYQVGADQIADCKVRFAVTMTKSTQVAMEYFAAVEKANELDAKCKRIMAEYTELNDDNDTTNEKSNVFLEQTEEILDRYAVALSEYTSAEFACNRALEKYLEMQKKCFMALTGCDV